MESNGICTQNGTHGDEYDHLSTDIRKATLKKYEQFERIRGKQCGEGFWDVVVLSALDVEQKKAYEVQLKEKFSRNELPLTTYHVINDPVGVKVGNGGGVITVLDQLKDIYNEKLMQLKVLILLSGGYSQRLPSASLLGKIYTALPLGDPLYQMIELKLTMYIDFPKRMKPGVIVSSADCIELYELEGDQWNLNNPGFTSMAYPSPIEIGTTHGVHVIENLEEHNEKSSCSSSIAKCRKFLHKPTKEEMRNSKAVFMKDGQEFVYSDSNYYMDMPTGMLLLNWYHERGGFQCEIDAYGDFLQALGPDATKDYCQNTKNVTVAVPSLVKTREEIFALLRNVQHNVLLLNKSKFYHIGTTKEYIENFCENKAFQYEMGLSNHAVVKFTDNQAVPIKDSNMMIHSILNHSVGFGENIIVEYTALNLSNSIGSDSIISNNIFPAGVQVPEKSFLHTVIIRDEAEPLYVTIAFGVHDNLKKCAKNQRDSSSLKYSGLPLNEALEKFNLSQNPWPEGCDMFNLWHAKIFSAFRQPEDALQNGASMLEACRLNRKYERPANEAASDTTYSMADVLKLKDLQEVLAMRRKLRKDIHE